MYCFLNKKQNVAIKVFSGCFWKFVSGNVFQNEF